MADTKVTNETDLGTLQGTEELYAVRGGTTDGKTTVAKILNSMGLSLPGGNPQNAGKPFIDGNNRIAISGGTTHLPELQTKNFELIEWVPPVYSRFSLGFAINPIDGDAFSFGGHTYTFLDTLTDSDGHIQIGATLTDTLDNLLLALTLSGTPGVQYAASTTTNNWVARANHTASDTLTIELVAGSSGMSVISGLTANGSPSFQVSTSILQTGVNGSLSVGLGYCRNSTVPSSWNLFNAHTESVDFGSFINSPGFYPPNPSIFVGVSPGSYQLRCGPLDWHAPLFVLTAPVTGNYIPPFDYNNGNPAIVAATLRRAVVPGVAAFTPISLPGAWGGPELISVLEYPGTGGVVDRSNDYGVVSDGTPFTTAATILSGTVSTTGSTLVIDYWDGLWSD